MELKMFYAKKKELRLGKTFLMKNNFGKMLFWPQNLFVSLILVGCSDLFIFCSVTPVSERFCPELKQSFIKIFWTVN